VQEPTKANYAVAAVYEQKLGITVADSFRCGSSFLC